MTVVGKFMLMVVEIARMSHLDVRDLRALRAFLSIDGKEFSHASTCGFFSSHGSHCNGRRLLDPRFASAIANSPATRHHELDCSLQMSRVFQMLLRQYGDGDGDGDCSWKLRMIFGDIAMVAVAIVILN
ncbi:hypothetical protein TIFTF001_017462 [Ficus carica]|uniref:Uncharacterized protein n=1 Tax=Ficus carica TaxID=3494 RepID=A0AA88DJ15_FICCA|nr:hypothetical protein TIFTF001_017462 [Ficus carica]